MSNYEELTITLPDGYPAYTRYWPVERPKGSVLYLHGIQSHAGWYEDSARHLQQAGFAVLQPDRRGSGRNRRDRGHADSAGQLIADAAACGRHLLAATAAPRLHLLGISWGGKLACAMLAPHRAMIASVTLVCPGLFPRVDVEPLEKLKIGLSMAGNRTRLFDIPLNDPALFTSQPRWITYLEGDQLSLHQVTASFFLATRKMDAAVAELHRCESLPLHLLLAGQDEIIDSPQTAEFVRRLKWPDTKITLYEAARHTLEFEPQCQAFCDDVVDWLSGRS